MSYAVIRQLLETRLQALAPVLPTAVENVSLVRQAGQAHQEVYLLPADTENPTMSGGAGGDLQREAGIFQVTLKYPENTGAGAAVARAQALRAHFPRGLVLSSGGVRLWVNATPSLGPGRPDDGFYALPLSVPYTADSTT